MKKKEEIFKRPVKVLQVFRTIHEYGKYEKSFADRKDKLVWKEVQSKNGYVADGILYLPGTILQDKKFDNCQLITIEDAADITPQPEWKIVNGKYERGNNHCFDLHHPPSYEIFRFHNDPLELSLKYSHSYIGEPSRNDFTVAALEKDVGVEVKINGKLDTSRGRYYKEQCFIFLLLGEFESCCFLTNKHPPVVKLVPAKRKLVDLWKPLW